MALVECRICGFRGFVGCMPGATCGLLVIVGLIFGAGASLGLAVRLGSSLSLLLKLPLIAVALIAGAVVGVFAVHFLPWTAEWLIAMCRRCPECGARKWSYPFTEGFGL